MDWATSHVRGHLGSKTACKLVVGLPTAACTLPATASELVHHAVPVHLLIGPIV